MGDEIAYISGSKIADVRIFIDSQLWLREKKKTLGVHRRCFSRSCGFLKSNNTSNNTHNRALVNKMPATTVICPDVFPRKESQVSFRVRRARASSFEGMKRRERHKTFLPLRTVLGRGGGIDKKKLTRARKSCYFSPTTSPSSSRARLWAQFSAYMTSPSWRAEQLLNMKHLASSILDVICVILLEE